MPLNGRHKQEKSVPAQTVTAEPRYDWGVDEILAVLQTPLVELVHHAQTIHRAYHEEGTVQLASLLSIKTGSCPEDCKYCPQSAHYAKKTGLEKETLLDVDTVLERARAAKAAGATRFKRRITSA